MILKLGNYEIYSDTKNIKLHESLEGVKKEFKNSVFIEVAGVIEEVPVDGRFYIVNNCYVKVKRL
ncbi:MAG: hypothetical protein JHC31_15015 [Sulfurihydrogenibium sp.]|jgi:hypothetical protein|nr:hypothetical protein [Sulfurihydrogenibium sp.]